MEKPAFLHLASHTVACQPVVVPQRTANYLGLYVIDCAFTVAEASTGAELTDAAETGSESANCEPSSQEAKTQGQQEITGIEDLKSKAKKDGHDSAAHGHKSQSEQGVHPQAAKTGCACCTLM